MQKSDYTNTVLFGDALQQLKTLPDGIAQCCVTSPPYWRLRDYGTGTWEGGDPDCDHVKTEIRKGKNIAKSEASTRGGGKKIADVPEIHYSSVCETCGAVRTDRQIGLEKTPELYVQKLVDIFSEVKRVLKADGTLWLNIGDSYAHDTKWGGSTGGKHVAALYGQTGIGRQKTTTGLKPKNLVGIPWRVAFALQADGWFLRSEIICHKPNCMPESVKDRPTNAHERIFLLTKSKRYYYDWEAISEPIAESTASDKRVEENNYSQKRPDRGYPGHPQHGSGMMKIHGKKRNKRTVWDVPEELFAQFLRWMATQQVSPDVWELATIPYKEAHYAVFPPKLITPCIKAGTREGNLVLDPFFGTGTTGEVALRLGRQYLGIELQPKNKPLQDKRLNPHKHTLFQPNH